MGLQSNIISYKQIKKVAYIKQWVKMEMEYEKIKKVGDKKCK